MLENDAQNSNIINITVIIGGRPYPLKIQSTDEASIRRIVKELNDMINRFQALYHNRDKQDFLAMTLLTYAVELHKAKQTTSVPEIDEKLDKVEQFLTYLVGK